MNALLIAAAIVAPFVGDLRSAALMLAAAIRSKL